MSYKSELGDSLVSINNRLKLLSMPNFIGHMARAGLIDKIFSSIGIDEASVRQAFVSKAALWDQVQLLDWLQGERPLDVVALGQLLQDVKSFAEQVQDLSELLDQAQPGRLLTMLMIDRLAIDQPVLVALSALLGFVSITPNPDALTHLLTRPGEPSVGAQATIHWSNLSAFVRDPTTYLERRRSAAFSYESALNFVVHSMGPLLVRALQSIGLEVELRPAIEFAADSPLEYSEHYPYALGLSYILGSSALVLDLIVGACQIGGAFGFTFNAASELDTGYETDRASLRLQIQGAQARFALGGFGVVYEEQAVSPELLLSFTHKYADPQAPFLFGIGSLLGLLFHEPTLSLRLSQDILQVVAQSELELVLGSRESGADSFLSSLLGALPVDAVKVPVSVIWEPERGLHFEASSDLSLKLALRSPRGLPVRLDGVTIEPGLGADALLEVGASLSADVGPVSLAVERFGLGFSLNEQTDTGFVSPSFSFLAPRGVSVAIAAPMVEGGGYLFFDKDKQEYAGALALRFGQLSLRALGIVTTLMPDGSDGFSMVVVISADFEPIQLGLGFTLSSVGGLLGIHRSMNIDAIRAGLKQGSLDAILLPSDSSPAAFLERAPQLLSTLGEFFPVTQGQYVFGPTVSLGWGTPTLVEAKLGVLIELPSPLRIALVGIVQMRLPHPDAPFVVIRMDVLGVLDPAAKTISLDATLFDSRLGPFALAGDMALRMSFGQKPSFLLSVGGFHPSFEPPASLPKLERLSLSLGSSDNPRLSLEAYLALTSNTLQLGAKASIYAREFGFALEASLGFDTLIRFNPFAFVVDLHASAMISRASSRKQLMSVALRLKASGPAPWRVAGAARFKVVGVSFEMSFDKTFGQPAQAETPVVEVWPLLKQALELPASWSNTLPGDQVFMLEPRDVAVPEALVHPMGALSVRQQVAPLGIVMQRLGVASLPNDAYFRIKALKVGGSALEVSALKEPFAPGEFLKLSDDERLSRPSFEPMDAGVTSPPLRLRTLGASRPRELAYTRRVVDEPRKPPVEDLAPTVVMGGASMLMASCSQAAAGRYQAIQGGVQGRYSAAELGVGLSDAEYVVARRDVQGGAVDVFDSYTSAAQAQASMPASQRADYAVLAAFEVGG